MVKLYNNTHRISETAVYFYSIRRYCNVHFIFIVNVHALFSIQKTTVNNIIRFFFYIKEEEVAKNRSTTQHLLKLGCYYNIKKTNLKQIMY